MYFYKDHNTVVGVAYYLKLGSNSFMINVISGCLPRSSRLGFDTSQKFLTNTIYFEKYDSSSKIKQCGKLTKMKAQKCQNQIKVWICPFHS